MSRPRPVKDCQHCGHKVVRMRGLAGWVLRGDTHSADRVRCGRSLYGSHYPAP